MKGNFEGKQLHWYWDHLFYEFSKDRKDEGEQTSPLTDKNKDFPAQYAAKIMRDHPRSSWSHNDYSKTEPWKWAEESLELAKNFVYKGIEEGGYFTNTYIDQARTHCMERLAIGGYRLAETMKWAFKNAVEKDEKLKESLRTSVVKPRSNYAHKAKKLLSL